MGMKARSTERKKTWHWLRVVEQPPFTYIHDGYNTLKCLPSAQRICALAHGLTAACFSGNPAFPLHARSLPSFISLLGALGSLAEGGLVGLVEVLGLTLLAVLSQQLVRVLVFRPSLMTQPDLLRCPPCVSRVYAPPTWRTSAQTRHASQQ